jgi:hypothetical protein
VGREPWFGGSLGGKSLGPSQGDAGARGGVVPRMAKSMVGSPGIGVIRHWESPAMFEPSEG